MLKIILERTPMEYITYHIEFTDDEGSGFSFNADVDGKIIIENEDQRKNGAIYQKKYGIDCRKKQNHAIQRSAHIIKSL